MSIYKDLHDFIELLNKHHVEYLVVGGYAVGHYGYERFTGDLDVWIKISEANADILEKMRQKFIKKNKK